MNAQQIENRIRAEQRKHPKLDWIKIAAHKIASQIGEEFEQYKKESIKWSWEDIYETAKEKGYKCSKKKAQKILECMIRKHDASLGITWDTIECWLDIECKQIKNKL